MSKVDDHGLPLRINGSRATTDATTTSAVILSDPEIASTQRRVEVEDELELSSDDETEEDRVEEDKMIKVDSLMQIRRWVKRKTKYSTTDTSTPGSQVRFPTSCRVVRYLDKLIVSVDNVVDLLDERRRRGFPKYEQRRAQRRRLRRAEARTASKIFDGVHNKGKSTKSEPVTPPSPKMPLLEPQMPHLSSHQPRTQSKSSLNQRRPVLKSNDQSTTLGSTETPSKIHRCPTCRKTFTSKQNLTQHRFVHLSDDEKAVAKQGWRHVCYFCDTRFKLSSLLTRHLVAHTKEKAFRCPQCGKQYARNSCLIRHKISHTANPRPFTCQECDRTFTMKTNLNRHKKSVHGKKKPIQCPKCDKTFSRNGDMVNHLKSVHLKIRHPCPHCDQSFKWKTTLGKHLRKVHPSKSRAK